MFRPLWGGTADTAGTPAFARSGRGSRAGPRRLGRRLRRKRPPPTRTRPEAPTRSRSSRRDFPTDQQLGQTSLLRIGVRNTGKKTIPALTVTISIAGKEGETSSLPFGIRDPQPELAQPDRPVWVLAEGCRRPRGPRTPRRVGQPGAARPRARRPSTSARSKPGREVEGDLEAERGQGRQLHPPLRGRRRPQRQRQGGDDRRPASPAAPSPSKITDTAAEHRSRPTAAKSSKSARAEAGQQVAFSGMRRRAACRHRRPRARPRRALLVRGVGRVDRAPSTGQAGAAAQRGRGGRAEADRRASTARST